MYYLGIKCNNDCYNLDYLDFYFSNLQDAFEFAQTILNNSNYEIVIKNCGDKK